jgi:hypothetical protein
MCRGHLATLSAEDELVRVEEDLERLERSCLPWGRGWLGR